MKKSFLLLLVVLSFTTACFSQFDKKIVGPITTNIGIVLKENDTLLLGKGSEYNGSFKYIKTGLMASSAQTPLSQSHNNTQVTIKGFRSQAVGSGVKLYASLKAGEIYTAFADLDDALKSKEIIGLNGYEIGKPRPMQQSMSTSSDNEVKGKENEAALERLQQLYIDGELSKADYAKRKAKLQGQGDGEQIRQTKPKSKSDGTTYTIKPFTENIEFKILSVNGSKNQQNVVVTYQLKTSLVNQKVEINNGYTCNFRNLELTSAYDSFGKQYSCNRFSLGDQTGSSRAENKLPTNILLRGSITFANVLPQISKFEYMNISMTHKNLEGGDDCESGTIEIRNLTIFWK
ncbi:SHOCT domain-containing protein [uncultured Fibrella sp.]|uniref:SHOCT domain-containing protein n=1 Tax=uncultured Fibrella sp. TaxID=1284596 RepID=UPI0035CB1ADD